MVNMPAAPHSNHTLSPTVMKADRVLGESAMMVFNAVKKPTLACCCMARSGAGEVRSLTRSATGRQKGHGTVWIGQAQDPSKRFAGGCPCVKQSHCLGQPRIPCGTYHLVDEALQSAAQIDAMSHVERFFRARSQKINECTWKKISTCPLAAKETKDLSLLPKIQHLLFKTNIPTIKPTKRVLQARNLTLLLNGP